MRSNIAIISLFLIMACSKSTTTKFEESNSLHKEVLGTWYVDVEKTLFEMKKNNVFDLVIIDNFESTVQEFSKAYVKVDPEKIILFNGNEESYDIKEVHTSKGQFKLSLLKYSVYKQDLTVFVSGNTAQFMFMKDYAYIIFSKNKNENIDTENLRKKLDLENLRKVDLRSFINDKNYRGLSDFLKTNPQSVNTEYFGGVTALIYACTLDDLQAIDILIKSGADLEVKNGYEKSTPLHKVSKYESLKLLVDSGSKIESEDSLGWSPLMKAISKENFEGAEYLLDKGAEPNTRSHKGKSILNLLNSKTPESFFKSLKKSGYKFELTKDSQNLNAAQWAAIRGDFLYIKKLLQYGVDLNFDDGQLLLYFLDDEEAFNYLRENIKGINLKNKELMKRAMQGSHIDVLKILLKAGSEISSEYNLKYAIDFKSSGNKNIKELSKKIPGFSDAVHQTIQDFLNNSF